MPGDGPGAGTANFSVALRDDDIAMILSALYAHSVETDHYLMGYREAAEPGPTDSCCDAHLARWEARRSEKKALRARAKQEKKLIRRLEQARTSEPVHEPPTVDATATTHVQQSLVAFSRLIDDANAHRDPEAVTWGRLAKITEEAGEVIEAFIGATGQNPRKGITKTMDDVLEELLDVAVTALGAHEHLDRHRGRSLSALDRKITDVAERAGLTALVNEKVPEAPLP